MNVVADFDISKILNTLNRRKGLIVSVFVVVSLLAAYLATVLPNVYQSSALILVTPQRVPTSFVASTVTIDLGERMQSITQEILSRTQLEKIVQEFNLYPPNKGICFRRSNQCSAQIHQDRISPQQRISSCHSNLKIRKRRNRSPVALHRCLLSKI